VQILTGAGWTGPYPDYHRAEGMLRIRVTTIATVERIRTQYFEQPKDLRRVWNYVREVGPIQVARKIRSRSDEGPRNEKYIWIGAGEVLEGDSSAPFVLFLATSHPRGVERIVVPSELATSIADSTWQSLVRAHEGPPVLGDAPAEALGPEAASLLGWNPHSGAPVPEQAAQTLLARAQQWLPNLNTATSAAEGSPWSGSSPISEVAPRGKAPESVTDGGTLSATLFGYGHYAKISLIPNLNPRICVNRVHEVDPTQVGPGPHDFTLDSAPTVREDMDVAFLAGFHHTHAPLAAEALRRGAHVVIEKPLATTQAQLDDLVAAMDGSRGTVHVGFHKRFQPFNDWAREDLGALDHDPISYYCIAYEVPLPEHHWYRWPNSGSRLLSNGCHWIDHFLFLNRFSAVRSLDVHRFPSGDVSTNIVLENDAAFHMILTDQGGQRIGVQDHIELRLRDRTVRIRNATHYESEDDRRVLRRESENKTHAYQTMYASISNAIVEGHAGDTVEMVQRSAGTVLDLEQKLNVILEGGSG